MDLRRTDADNCIHSFWISSLVPAKSTLRQRAAGGVTFTSNDLPRGGENVWYARHFSSLTIIRHLAGICERSTEEPIEIIRFREVVGKSDYTAFHRLVTVCLRFQHLSTIRRALFVTQTTSLCERRLATSLGVPSTYRSALFMSRFTRFFLWNPSFISSRIRAIFVSQYFLLVHSFQS